MKAGVLTLNAGSSSLKFALFSAAGTEALARGEVEGFGAKPRLRITSEGRTIVRDCSGVADANGALEVALGWLETAFSLDEVGAIGHRIVHGGIRHSAPVILDDEVLADLAALEPLAPLHQPFNLAGVRAARARFPDRPQVACFDTAFHRTHPFEEDAYALPLAFYDAGVRRYGFHGLSYESVVARLEQVAPALVRGRIVIAHLGNGASMCAVRDGRSVGSTMGFTALDGLPMGTRCGQIDPGVLLWLMTERKMDADAITDLLYRKSGLKGLSGLSHDMRELEAAATDAAQRAIGYFVARIRRELGALAAVLGGVDGLIFTAGIGENSRNVRAAVMEGLGWLGIVADPEANARHAEVISAPSSSVRVMIIPTDEEAIIASHVANLLPQS